MYEDSTFVRLYLNWFVNASRPNTARRTKDYGYAAVHCHVCGGDVGYVDSNRLVPHKRVLLDSSESMDYGTLMENWSPTHAAPTREEAKVECV